VPLTKTEEGSVGRGDLLHGRGKDKKTKCEGGTKKKWARELTHRRWWRNFQRARYIPVAVTSANIVKGVDTEGVKGYDYPRR